jgi:hypothetical protein
MRSSWALTWGDSVRSAMPSVWPPGGLLGGKMSGAPEAMRAAFVRELGGVGAALPEALPCPFPERR